MAVTDFLDQYYEHYVVAESLSSVASIRSRLGSLKDALGTLPVGALERTETIEDFKGEYGKTRSIAAVNRTLGILRHAINWGRGRTPPIFIASPFDRFGVKIKTNVETKRDRRITPDEERKLLEPPRSSIARGTRSPARKCVIGSWVRSKQVAAWARC